jgi:pimeloyl-ACP methyl ester carboxylesterase/predicted ATPase
LNRSAHREAIELLKLGLEMLQHLPDTPERTERELALQAMFAPALIATQGWGSPDAERAYLRALDLCTSLGGSRQRDRVLFGLAIMLEYRAEYQQSAELIEKQLRIDRRKGRELVVESYDLLACSLYHQGSFTTALDQAEQGLSLYDPQQRYTLIARFGENPGVRCQIWSALSLWFLGYPDQALDRARLAVNKAQEHLYSLAHAQTQLACVHQLRREPQLAQQYAEMAIAVATEQAFPYRVADGRILQGWAIAVQGQVEDGIQLVHAGLDICRTMGAMLDYPYFLALLADACSRAGRVDEGLIALAGAQAMVLNSRSFHYEAELHRLKGDLLLQTSRASKNDDAEECFAEALAVARRQGAKSLELRAAVSLGRLWREQGKAAQARQMLSEIYGWFTEGFDTVDLKEAKALLKDLGGAIPLAGAAVPLLKTLGVPTAPAQLLSRAVASTSRHMEQQIRFAASPDGVRIAYATVGTGPVLVKAANWLSHLEYDWNSPVWRHWLAGLSGRHTLVRYDRRGCGLSDWDVKDMSLEARLQDLETVVTAVNLDRFALLGLSGGGSVAMAYAVRHPERVSHLILYGCYARGRLKRELTAEQIEELKTLRQVMQIGWGKPNAAFRQVYTTLFIPDGAPEQIHWFNDLQRISTSPDIAVRIVMADWSDDLTELARQVAVPTLVLHAREDAVVPFEEGRRLAALISGAQFVPLESKNHILLESEPAWQRFVAEVHHFLG